jgi:hypothetical protein
VYPSIHWLVSEHGREASNNRPSFWTGRQWVFLDILMGLDEVNSMIAKTRSEAVKFNRVVKEVVARYSMVKQLVL